MVYLKTFKLSDKKISNENIYPYCVLKNKEPNVFIFENTTILYGNNGSGKSTILNIIAHKLNLKGKERNNPEVIGTVSYFEDFANDCTYELGEKENIEKYKLREKEYTLNKSKVITLCGSIKFKETFLKEQEKLTLEGNIVFPLTFSLQ